MKKEVGRTKVKLNLLLEAYIDARPYNNIISGRDLINFKEAFGYDMTSYIQITTISE